MGKKTYNDLLTSTLYSKHWENVGSYCNGVTHPMNYRLGYRPYRRGSNRCSECGGKFGKSKYERRSAMDNAIENIYEETPFLKWLMNKGENNGETEKERKIVLPVRTPIFVPSQDEAGKIGIRIKTAEELGRKQKTE